MTSSESSGVLRETSYYRLDQLVSEMRHTKTGLPLKLHKTLFSAYPNACSGRDLVLWIQANLAIESEAEALHLANMLSRLGFLVPLTERSSTIKPDTCLRIQIPALWPSRKWDSTSSDYAVYLLKRYMKGKSLETFEQTAMGKLEQMFSSSWSEIKKSAKDSVKKYNHALKADRDTEDSQERVFWRVHRPPPGHKPHHYRGDGFKRNAICMESIKLLRPKEYISKRIESATRSLQKCTHHSDLNKDSIVTMVNYCNSYYNYDSTVCKRRLINNVWIAIDQCFYEDLEIEEETHTRLDYEIWALGFRELLRDSYGKRLFAHFLEKEFSKENLHFWDACEDLKQCPQSKVEEKVSRIKRTFLQSSSSLEVNLDRAVLKATLEATKCPTRYCMDAAQQHIFMLMKEDSYPRFLKSDLYKQLFQGDSKRATREGRSSFSKKTQPPGRFKKITAAASSSPMKLFLVRRSPSPRTITTKLQIPSIPDKLDGLSSDSNLSPFYSRKMNTFNRSPSSRRSTKAHDADQPVRKAGSLSSLVISRSHE